MRSTLHRILLFTIFLASLVSLGHESNAQDMVELEVDHALTFEFATPHTKWAQPYARGKIRVLFFTDGRGTNPRECVELMQRFDIEGQAVFYARIVDSDKSSWLGDEIGEQRMLNLLEQKWDCFVFLGLPMSNVPSEQKRRIREAVREGAGIVFVGSDDSALLQEDKRTNPPPPTLSAGPVGDAYTIEQGRGIRLPNRPNIDYYEGWEVDYDYWQERLGRAVLWAAGREPVSQLHMTISPAEPLTEASKKRLSITLFGKLLGENPLLHLSLRRPGDHPIPFPEKEISDEKPIDFEIPKLSEGTYHADALVMSAAGVETWNTLTFEIRPDRRIAEIKLDRSWGEPGGVIQGSVTLAGTSLPTEVLRVQLLDRKRRELVRKDLDLSANPDSTQFQFEIVEWLPMLTTVEARLLSGGDEISKAYQYFHVTKRRQGQFNFLVWDVPRGTLAPYAEESLARHGVTLQLAKGNPPPYVGAFDIAWMPYTTRILAEKTTEGIMKPFCWNDANAVEKNVRELAANYQSSREHGTFVYSLGDENDTSGCCLSGDCAAAYCEYLKEVYSSLEALNRSWSTDFKGWDEVRPSREGDNEEENSLRNKNYPRWFDLQAFKSWNYIKYCLKYREAYKAMDPFAKTGFEGAGKFAGGDDLDLIVRSLDFWSPYPGTADEVIRSIAPRDFIRSNWLGYTKDADSLLQKFWRMAILGMDSVWWWRWDCVGRYHGWLAPDFRPYPAVKEILEDTQIMRDGLGDLLMRSQRQDDGVAILYSYPSTFAYKLDEGATYGGYEETHLWLHKLLRSMGVQFRYVTDRMLRLGEFDASKYRILFLPRAEAIGDKEADVIRKFVEGGGTLVADVRPGIYDDHCKPRKTGVLDDLFGITRVSRAPAEITTTLQGALGLQCKIDPGIRVANGTPAQQFGETPVMVARKTGNGFAVLLNCDMNSVARFSTSPPSKEDEFLTNMSVLRNVFSPVTPRLTLESHEGKHPDDIRIARWQDGAIEIVGLFRETGSREDVTVSLSEANYIYDLRNRRFLGREKRFITTIIPSRASFFVLCKKAVPSPKLSVDRASAALGTVVKASLSVPGSEGLHAFRVCVRSENHGVDLLNRIVIVGHNEADFAIPIAFNDQVGEYEVDATDLITNLKSSAKIRIR